eukprot:3017377-Pleurochrysis_carterae.AAC.1
MRVLVRVRVRVRVCQERQARRDARREARARKTSGVAVPKRSAKRVHKKLYTTFEEEIGIWSGSAISRLTIDETGRAEPDDGEGAQGGERDAEGTGSARAASGRQSPSRMHAAPAPPPYTHSHLPRATSDLAAKMAGNHELAEDSIVLSLPVVAPPPPPPPSKMISRASVEALRRWSSEVDESARNLDASSPNLANVPPHILLPGSGPMPPPFVHPPPLLPTALSANPGSAAAAMPPPPPPPLLAGAPTLPPPFPTASRVLLPPPALPPPPCCPVPATSTAGLPPTLPPPFAGGPPPGVPPSILPPQLPPVAMPPPPLATPATILPPTLPPTLPAAPAQASAAAAPSAHGDLMNAIRNPATLRKV